METSHTNKVKAPQHLKTPRARERHRRLALRVVLLQKIIYDEFEFVDVFHLLIYARVRVRVEEVAIQEALRAHDVGPVWSETVSL